MMCHGIHQVSVLLKAVQQGCNTQLWSPASNRTAPGVCSWDLSSPDMKYFGRTVLGCVIKGSSPHTQGTQRHKGKWESHNIPVRDTRPWAGLGLSQESLSLIGWRWYPPHGATGAAPRITSQVREGSLPGYGTYYGMQGKNIWGLHNT